MTDVRQATVTGRTLTYTQTGVSLDITFQLENGLWLSDGSLVFQANDHEVWVISGPNPFVLGVTNHA